MRQKLLFAMRRIRYAIRFAGSAVSVDPSSWVSPRCTIRVCGGGSVTIGRNCGLHPYAMIQTYGGNVEIGDNCSLNPFVMVYGHGGVRLGNGVRVATQTVIIPANHNVVADGEALFQSGYTAAGIDIGDHVWLGAGARILDGVTIGSNAVVAAGGVVTRSVAENTVVGGVPAKPIRRQEKA